MNDNLLKGSGLAPAWLTGKLSDLAFLVVAPVLLAALLPVTLPERRALAVAAVVLVYAAADLSPTVSEAIVGLAARVGLRWRLWPDPTDLLALAVLPVTWRCLSAGGPGAASPPARAASRLRPLVESLGIWMGAFACLATSGPPEFPHAPFLVNQTSAVQPVRLTWLLRRVDCQTDLAELAGTLDPSDLDEPRSADLASGEVATLEAPLRPGQPLVGHCPAPRGTTVDSVCTGVMVEAPGLAVLVVAPTYWLETERPSRCCEAGNAAGMACRLALDADPGLEGLALRERDGTLAVTAGDKLRVIPIVPASVAARPADPAGCRALIGQHQAIVQRGSTCAVDADCRSIEALPVPGGACHLPTGSQPGDDAELADLRVRWTEACVVARPHTCPPPQPVICRTGACREICEGLALAWCPGKCRDLGARRLVAGASCPLDGLTCEDDQGAWCTCTGRIVRCAPPPLPPGCSIACVPRE